MNKRKWLEINVGRDFVVGFDELGIDFYYMAMHDNGMDLYDADKINDCANFYRCSSVYRKYE